MFNAVCFLFIALIFSAFFSAMEIAFLASNRLKIEVDKNHKLSEALRVKILPTLMIYKDSEMVWRQSGEQDANTLISLIQDHVA